MNLSHGNAFRVAGDVIYDGLVALDRRGVTLRRYYFPLGTSKRIPYGEIRRVRERPMGQLTGKWRLWAAAT